MSLSRATPRGASPSPPAEIIGRQGAFFRILLGLWIVVLACALAFDAAAQRRKRANKQPPAEVQEPAEVVPLPHASPEAALAAAPEAAPTEPATAAQPKPAPAAEPSAEEAAATGAEPPPSGDAELAALQAELASVMDELVQARARVAVLGKSLFATTVRVRVDNQAAPEQQAVRAMLRLDGAPIWTGDAAALRDPERVLFEGYAAPGPHVLELELEQRARDDETYGYQLRESYRFVVLQKHRTDLDLVLEDDSDIAEDFADDQEGEYEVTTRLEVKAIARGED